MDLTAGDLLLCEFYFSDLQTSKRRPVIVFKDNLPFDDFVGIPVSSQTYRLHADEFILEAVQYSPVLTGFVVSPQLCVRLVRVSL